MILAPNIYDLQSVSFADRLQLPPRPGVYFISDFPKVYYIGSTKNLRERWSNHNRAEQIQAMVNPTIYWMECAEAERFTIERMCTELYRPVWNKTKQRKRYAT